MAAFYIKGLCGFANTLVFTSILGFGVNNIAISPVELMLGYPTNLILTYRHRKQLDIKIFLPLSILVLLGSIPGALLLKNANTNHIKAFFGVIIILLGIEMYLREVQTLKFKESKVLLLIIGILSGVLCGLFGVGALLAAYIGRVADTSNEFKANISAVFIVDNTFRLILYSVLGIITFSSIKQAAILLPFVLIGLFTGIKSATIIDEKIVKRIVIILLIISGVMLILKSV
ncbi:sulfite exporter TauE/SafE family protein [Butyrivibrio fibrisolvens]|uniref:sulfite exporter TauE/SafE family protein n=1 Tax=Pseudobutyrivibrio ruminis TaxID=46206 RepID=UPI001FA7345A|nr:sulfite exporter TauE/SafE family protein [Pseudobutyrivibrio ruminis]MDC7280110.1 sulfite exporter TauE/SafE family protein [Butyrivibrio fibrisolvens]